ncbi:NADH-cytochrome b5 reductase-like [Aplysia californica]|uniref:NADH-cytochrome b5 reductase n=1 Tax=Aplysia californica TaxID=6500 RepID=A0ABM0JZG5_APLCA|nr:NADH-cytochrome b5 reductase-like [Aplysia californica]
MTSTTEDFDTDSEAVMLPEPPERPLDSDCCGNGCVPCVFDIYEEEVALWEAECKRLRTGGKIYVENKEEPQASPLMPDQYNHYGIESISQETCDAVRIRCTLSPQQKLGLSMGQHIIIRCQKPDGPMITRQYTPISPVDTKGFFELAIKIYTEGQMSQLVKNWKVGERLEARGPIGHLSYSRNKFSRILMLCAGTGVAPMCQVISSVLSDELEDTYLRLVYACRSYKQLLAKMEIDEWRRFWNFSTIFVLSQEPDPPSQSYKYGEEVLRGHVDKDLILSELGNNMCSTFILVCGTRSFEMDTLKALKEIGVPNDNVHKF